MTESMTVYRRSELEAVASGCLHRYRKIWIDGVDDTSDPAIVGISLHLINYLYVMSLVEAKTPQDSELAYDAFIKGVAQSQTPSRLIPEVRQVWEWHAERFELNLEQFVTAEVREVSGAVTFTPDLVTVNPTLNELEIHDFKFGWQPPMSEEELRALFQARVYVRYGKDRWPNFSKYRFTLHAARFNVTVSVVFTETELEEIEREVLAAIAAVEHAKSVDSWPAVPGPSCRFCELQCPVAEVPAIVPKRLTLPEQAEAVASWLLASSAVTKVAKKSLKAYCSAHGPVSVNGVVFDNRKTTTRQYPIDEVLEVIRLRNVLGAFTEEGLTISHSALAKLFKRFPQLEEDLKPFVQSKDGYRFGQKDEDRDGKG